ncbi:MAG TPA: class I SAM-dependent methyltransferase, partial [Desulfobacteria bacterium]|nr:class I SAM-dependent methyltransferase [Desulfobacteria bacterium]
MNRTIVTTTHQPDDNSVLLGRQAASSLNTVYADRQRMSLEKLREKYSCENILVIKNHQLTLFSPLGEYFFHPSMSVPRIKAIKEGKTDHMVEAMQLKSGYTVLDCTMGLGADAIVAAFVSGPGGHVTGLESSPEIAYIVSRGLITYNDSRPQLKEAMSRIDVINDNYNDFLAKQQESSFDIVYFDPMFR